MFQPPQNTQKTFCSGWCNTSCRCEMSHSQLDNKSTTGMPILHAEALFISAERGLRQGILSRTSLKCHIHFSFIPKLAIFIHKQLKRPVAFGAVHFGGGNHSSDNNCHNRGCQKDARTFTRVFAKNHPISMWCSPPNVECRMTCQVEVAPWILPGPQLPPGFLGGTFWCNNHICGVDST